MAIYLHQGDLPSDFQHDGSVAIDTETMGLDLSRDRLCLLQISNGNGDAHLIQFKKGCDFNAAKNLKALLIDPDVLKIFHFARFDILAIKNYLNVECAPIYCTKIASRLVRTYTDRHGLKELCREVIGVDISKQQQSSDWGAETLSEDQQKYAASDVLYLHGLKEKLDARLIREGRMDIAQKCWDFLPTRVSLDALGWYEGDFFSH